MAPSRTAIAVGVAVLSGHALAAGTLSQNGCTLDLPAGWTANSGGARFTDGSAALLEVTFNPKAFVQLLQQSPLQSAIDKNGATVIVTLSDDAVIKEVHGVSGGVGAAGKACHVEIAVASPSGVAPARALAGAIRHP